MREKIEIAGSNNVTIEMERCSKCILPITWESIFYDENGVCNICNNWSSQKEKIDWDERKVRLEAICEKAKAEAKRRNNKYHCIVPFSGGKDTSYILWYTVTQLKLRPLVVTFDHGFFRPRMLENRMRTFRKLGVDVGFYAEAAGRLSIPLIAGGGFGAYGHIVDLFQKTQATGCALGKMLVLRDFDIIRIKAYLRQAGVPVRDA